MGQDFQHSLLGLVELLCLNPAKPGLSSVIPNNGVSVTDAHQSWRLTFWQEDFKTLSTSVTLCAWMLQRDSSISVSQTYCLWLFAQKNKPMSKEK